MPATDSYINGQFTGTRTRETTVVQVGGNGEYQTVLSQIILLILVLSFWGLWSIVNIR